MFDINCLSLSNVNENHVSTLCGIGDEYLPRALDYILTSESNMIEMKKEFSICMLESEGSIIAINEGLSDYKYKIKSAIDKFLKFIKDMWARFVRALASVVKSDKYLRKNKALIDLFNDSCNFDFQDYEWTFDESVPSTNIVSAIFTADVSALEDTLNNNSLDNSERLKVAKEKYNELITKNRGDYFDSIRASVLGKSGGKISAEEYKIELFKIFRNNSEEKVEKTITSKDVSCAYSFFMDYEKSLKSVKETKDSLEREYKQVARIFSNANVDGEKLSIDMSEHNSKDYKYNGDPELIKYVNMYMKQKGDEIITISNIHSLAFAAKMDAFKEKFKASRKICYEAIAQVQKNKVGEK